MAYYPISSAVLEHLKKSDKKLKKLIEMHGVIKRKIEEDVFKALVFNIISQQISTKAANTIKTRLLALIKTISPKNIVELSDDELQAVGLSFRKVNYIKTIALKVSLKELDLKRLNEMEDEAIIKELIKLPGIGVWTAEMMLIFTFKRENVLSYLDLGIRRGVKRLYNLEEVNKEQFMKLKNIYSPYASVASLYLWQLASIK